MNKEIEQYMDRLAQEIVRRYELCPPVASPDTILLAIANAIQFVNSGRKPGDEP